VEDAVEQREPLGVAVADDVLGEVDEGAGTVKAGVAAAEPSARP
jgi:hypothetical protein